MYVATISRMSGPSGSSLWISQFVSDGFILPDDRRSARDTQLRSPRSSSPTTTSCWSVGSGDALVHDTYQGHSSGTEHRNRRLVRKTFRLLAGFGEESGSHFIIMFRMVFQLYCQCPEGSTTNIYVTTRVWLCVKALTVCVYVIGGAQRRRSRTTRKCTNGPPSTSC